MRISSVKEFMCQSGVKRGKIDGRREKELDCSCFEKNETSYALVTSNLIGISRLRWDFVSLKP
jgi:hypothetical protein